MPSLEPPAYAIDVSRWPLVRLRATSAVDSTAALDVTYRDLEQLLARRGRFLLLFDLRGARSSPSRRRRLLDWGLAHESELRALVGAMALVAGTSLERGFVTALLWLQPVPWPQRVFSSASEAETWLMQEHHTSQMPTGSDAE